MLIADEEDSLRDELDRLLRREGYATHLAADDVEALELIREVRVHIVVLQFELPSAGGLDVFRAMKQEVREHVPCVFTAEEISSRVQFDALLEDAFTVVPKPVDAGVLTRVVRSALRRYYR